MLEHDVLVRVERLSGKIVNFCIPARALIEDVKVLLKFGPEGVPVEFQTLLCGESEVHDQDSLEQWKDENRVVKLTLLLTASRSLGPNAGKTRKLAALRDLATQKRKGDFVKYAIPHAASCLEDVVDEVREGAVQALTALAAASRDQALAEVRDRLGHPDWSVRQHAVKALQQISPPDDPHSIASLKELMRDDNIRVRVAVVLALMSLLKSDTDSCEDETVRELKASLQDSHPLAKQLTIAMACQASSALPTIPAFIPGHSSIEHPNEQKDAKFR
mmetsp:Transcript_43855/g.102433  ORF Transcript_43855/g.102433 Transcript_43855/m.102433 type:complete len:275 (-) Transcript_43855:47-871(-)